MVIPYTYHPKLVMRTPQNSLRITIGAENDFLQGLLKDKNFLEALFLASPVLHEELLKYGQGTMSDTKGIKKLIFSLAKYHLRMSSRCTPFGLFSGCAVTQWDDGDTALVIDTDSKLDRHTRFDMHYLCALTQHIAALPFIKTKLRYYPNTAFYKMAEEIRYVEYHYRNGRRKHIISAVLASDYTMDILQAAANGITVQDIINRLVGEEVTEEEAAEFTDEIIAAQLLVSEMEPSVTGYEFLYQTIASLKKINTASEPAITEITGMLEQINTLIGNIDVNGINDSTVYTQITDCLTKFSIPFELNKLFQCDLNITLKENKINSSVKTQLAEALHMVNLSNKTIENANLTTFASRFYERYEDAELPLLEVLDNETGIGYAEQHTGNITPLLDGMAVGAGGGGNTKFEWSARDKFFFSKLLTANETRQPVITFQESDFTDFKNGWDSLPPSISVMFRLLDDDRILLENSGSSSAANLLARFAHGNKDIHTIIDDVVKDEDEKNPSVIFAEIVHLPESRIGNILLHPSFRKYEIPFLSRSAVVPDCQVLLSDLLVSVKGNIVFLRSKKLNKIIIPRLSSAHNYSFGALPIYQFLADLQLQGKQGGILFNWGILENQFTQLPRAMYKNVVLKEAQWNFVKKDIEILVNKPADFTAAINQFKEKWRLPSLIVLADGDNELLINLEDKLMVEVWLEAVKNRSSFTIKEFLGGTKNSPVKDNAGNLYANQFIAVLMRNTAAYNFPELQKEETVTAAVQQNFILGTEWVYYKLYCGHKTADTVLQNVMQPLVNELKEKNIIDSFFFIRYNDPHFHLRVRFHVTAVEKLGTLLHAVQEYVDPFLQQRLIWDIQNETYKRELNRYGHQTVTDAEKLFFHDSVAVMDFLAQTEGDNREQLRWQWTFRAIDEWLNAFNYTTAKKLSLLEQMKNSYHKEFNSNKYLKELLGNKYRAHKPAIEQMMNAPEEETHPLFSLIKILKDRTTAMRPIVKAMLEKESSQKVVPAVAEVMPSYIHMLVNRIVTSSPREHELVIYDLLYCFYKSKVAREKSAPAAEKNRTTLKMAV